MKITVIGYHGGSAPADEATSSYLLDTGEEKILLDCGAGAISQLQKIENLNGINNCIISHYHYDHFSDIGAFIYNRLIKMQLKEVYTPLNIYGQEDDTFFKTFLMEGYSNTYPITEDSSIELGRVKFTFKLTEHPMPCLAIKGEKDGKIFVYTADTAYNEAMLEFCRGVDLMITECSLYPGFDGRAAGHINVEDAIKFINETGAKHTLISHLPIYGDLSIIENTIREGVNTKVTIASKFLEIEI